MDESCKHQVWEAMADQFLDQDVRYDLPRVAELCVSAEVSIDEAKHTWRYHVTPVVHWNTRSMAGVWTGWDRATLFRIIEAREREAMARWQARSRTPGIFARLKYRLQGLVVHDCWMAIEELMAFLPATPAVDRAERTRELTWLARVFFDVSPDVIAQPKRVADEVGHLYTRTFLPIFRPLLFDPETKANAVEHREKRILRALGTIG